MDKGNKDKGNKTEIIKFLFSPVRNGNFCGTFQRNVSFVGFKGMGWQTFYNTPSFNASNSSTPFVFCKCVGNSL